LQLSFFSQPLSSLLFYVEKFFSIELYFSVNWI
jgi:hypothetical protein